MLSYLPQVVWAVGVKSIDKHISRGGSEYRVHVFGKGGLSRTVMSYYGNEFALIYLEVDI